MKFQGQVTRKSRKKKRKLLPFLIPTIVIAVFLFFYFVNARLTPIYIQYAEVQTEKIASHVINKAINSRVANVLDVNEIIVDVPNESEGGAAWKFNTEIINRVLSETQGLVESHLQQAEEGNLEMLPSDNGIEFDPQAMESHGGIVFFVPVGQAANIPLLGNLGPKIPIRFHVIGEVSATVDTEIRPFGINSAYVEVNILLTVNVQIIMPLATEKSVVKQKIPVAIGLIQGTVPQINYSGSGDQPNLQVPILDSFEP
ncbi:MAG: sporulation protein YunB [Sporosarcina sp.]